MPSTAPQPSAPGDPPGGLGSLRRRLATRLADPQVLALVLLLAGGLLGIVLFGATLAPGIAALVVAYVLQAPVRSLTERGLPRLLSVNVVFVGFLSVVLFGFLAVVPLLTEQLSQLVLQLPSMVNRVQDLALALPQRYPELIAREQVVELIGQLKAEALQLGQAAVAYSVNRIGNLFTIAVYLFLVPLLVFFFLKDRNLMVAWLLGVLPRERQLAARVWREVDQKIGAYIRGKIYEIGILTAVTWVTFTLLGVDFAALLAAVTGLSVLVPYIGVAAAAIPVGFVALVQFGPGADFALAIGAYAAIQILDGNLLAPLLISEVVNIHPVLVVAAILVFGGVWGFWGVFFAIPLATLAVAVVRAWPRGEGPEPGPAGPTGI